MANIKLCAAQVNVSDSFNKNIENAHKLIKKASDDGCDIICFPELFLTGPSGIRDYNHGLILKSKSMFSSYCKDYGIFCVMGSAAEKINKRYYNISYLIDNKGCILGNYKKIHLTKDEAKHLTPGNNVCVFSTKLGKVGIQICRDLLYPELTRKMLLSGAQIIFCPSFWCSKSSSYDYIYNNKYFKNKIPREVDYLASSRAIESEVVFVYVNAAGKFKSKEASGVLLGRTQISLPFYGTTNILPDNKEGAIMKNVNLDITKDAKLVYKIEKDIKRYYN